MAVTGPARKREVGLMLRPGQKPENVELYLEQQYIVQGWNDITATLNAAKVTGASQPSWSALVDGIYAYEFSASTMNELWVTFHVEHDYADGTKVYPHIHWSPPSGSSATGVVRWGFEYTVQKGHQQGAFPSTTTIYVEDNVSTADPLGHRVAEASDAQAFSVFEADALVLMRIFRDAAHANDTFTDTAFGLTADLHFQTDRQSTPNRSPPFTAR